MSAIVRPKPAPEIRQDWLDRRKEEILEPALPIVDPHHHLWDRPGSRYLLDDLLADVKSGHNIMATVYVEWQSMYRADGLEEMKPVGETEFANGVGAMSASGFYGPIRACAGIVSHADLRLGARVQDVLEAHIRAGGSRLRGIRQSVACVDDPFVMSPTKERPPGLMSDSNFRQGFARLAPLDLSFDVMAFHPQIDEATALARDFPETRIVLNHIGAVLGIGSYAGRRDEIFDSWSRSVRALAKYHNVWVKIGGMAQRFSGINFHELAEPPSSEALAAAWRPYVETCIEAFGPARCMFESNFPVDKASYSYAAFWNACKRLAHGASDAEKADLFSRTAARFYRLDLPGFRVG